MLTVKIKAGDTAELTSEVKRHKRFFDKLKFKNKTAEEAAEPNKNN